MFHSQWLIFLWFFPISRTKWPSTKARSIGTLAPTQIWTTSLDRWLTPTLLVPPVTRSSSTSCLVSTLICRKITSKHLWRRCPWTRSQIQSLNFTSHRLSIWVNSMTSSHPTITRTHRKLLQRFYLNRWNLSSAKAPWVKYNSKRTHPNLKIRIWATWILLSTKSKIYQPTRTTSIYLIAWRK